MATTTTTTTRISLRRTKRMPACASPELASMSIWAWPWARVSVATSSIARASDCRTQPRHLLTTRSTHRRRHSQSHGSRQRHHDPRDRLMVHQTPLRTVPERLRKGGEPGLVGSQRHLAWRRLHDGMGGTDCARSGTLPRGHRDCRSVGTAAAQPPPPRNRYSRAQHTCSLARWRLYPDQGVVISS